MSRSPPVGVTATIRACRRVPPPPAPPVVGESRANREGRRSIDLRSGDVSGHSRQRRHRHHSEVLAPPAVNGAVTALAAALGSLFVYTVVVMFGWVFAADHSSLESMFDMASIAWLAAHLAPIEAGARSSGCHRCCSPQARWRLPTRPAARPCVEVVLRTAPRGDGS